MWTCMSTSLDCEVVMTVEAERAAPDGRGMYRAVSSRVYVPAVGIAAVAVVLVVVGGFTGFGGAPFSGSVSTMRFIVGGPASMAIIAVFLVAERLRPAQRRPLIARGHRHDLLFTVLNATVVVPLVAALSLSFSAMARTA